MNLLEEIFEKQYALNKRILKERHNRDYDQLCDQDKNEFAGKHVAEESK